MQPNLPQDMKFRYAAKDAVMARYLKLRRPRRRTPPGARAGSPT